MQKIIIILVVLFVICAVIGLCSGCRSQQPIIADTGIVEQLRYEYQQLRNEYDKLQSDYSRLVEESNYYAEYYRNATAAIETGLAKLNEIGSGQLAEISALRTNIAIIRNIIQAIIDGERKER